MLNQILGKVFGTKHERDYKRMLPRIEEINVLETGVEPLTDEQLRERLLGFNERFREWIDADVFTISGLTAAGIGGVRRVRERRKPKRRRFGAVGEAVGEALGGARERLPGGR